MFEKMKRIAALLLVVVMVFSLTACKKNKNDDTSSDYIEYVTEYEYVTEEGEEADGEEGDGGSKKTPSKKDPSKTSDPGKKPDPTPDPNTDPYVGKTVRYAVWADHRKEVIDAFTKKTGINVKIDSTSQGDYTNTIASKIASATDKNPGPDVFYCNSFFPWCISVIQPITAMELDLSDPMWDQGTIKWSTIKGKPYLINTIGNYYTEVDCLYFNKNVLKQAGVPESMYPDKQYEAGTWTWDAMALIMKQVKEQLGETYTGAYIDYTSMLASAGVTNFVFKNGKFYNALDQHAIDVNTKLAEWYTAGYVKGYGMSYRDEFISGKTAFAVTHDYGLKKEGYWKNMNANHLGFTYIPDFSATCKSQTSGLNKTWALCKGSSEPVAAGKFLRYYLDVNNYKTSELFLNKEAESFFFKLTTGVGMDQKVVHLEVEGLYCATTPDQVATKVKAAQATDYAEYNELIDKNTK